MTPNVQKSEKPPGWRRSWKSAEPGRRCPDSKDSSKRPAPEPGETVRDFLYASGTGTEVWVRRLSRRLDRKKVVPAAAERAC